MVDELSDARVAFELFQNLLLAFQANFRRMLEYELFMCRTTVTMFSGYCKLLILE